MLILFVLTYGTICSNYSEIILVFGFIGRDNKDQFDFILDIIEFLMGQVIIGIILSIALELQSSLMIRGLTATVFGYCY